MASTAWTTHVSDGKRREGWIKSIDLIDIDLIDINLMI